MIIRDNTAKSGDPHEEEKARSNGEELQIDLGRTLTGRRKDFCKIKRRPAYVRRRVSRSCPDYPALFLKKQRTNVSNILS